MKKILIMKLFEVYKGVIHEAEIEACVKNYGKELFSPQLGGSEKNTNLEDKYLEHIHDFTDNQYGEETTPEFMTALKNLKKCAAQYPEVLIPDNTNVYRGLTLPISYFIKNRMPISMEKEFPYTYKARSPIQSWSTNYKAAQFFGNHDIINEVAKKLNLSDYQTPEARQELLKTLVNEDVRLAFVITYKANKSEFLFNSEYFKVLSSMYVEEEVIRMTNKPINVMAKFNDSEDVFFTFDAYKLIKLVNLAISEM
jgi:hypothetical protein